MEKQILFDLSEIVGKVTDMLLTPYSTFISELHAAGRITDAEVMGLQQELESRIPRLDEFVEDALHQDRETQSPPPLSGQA
jgi:hypothetical protein